MAEPSAIMCLLDAVIFLVFEEQYEFQMIKSKHYEGRITKKGDDKEQSPLEINVRALLVEEKTSDESQKICV